MERSDWSSKEGSSDLQRLKTDGAARRRIVVLSWNFFLTPTSVPGGPLADTLGSLGGRGRTSWLPSSPGRVAEIPRTTGVGGLADFAEVHRNMRLSEEGPKRVPPRSWPEQYRKLSENEGGE